MNRRDFLKMLGVGIAAPKLIFDMGKNSRLYSLLEAHPRFKIPYMTHPDVPENTIYFINGSGIELIDDPADGWTREYDRGVMADNLLLSKDAYRLAETYRGLIINLKA